MPRGNGIGPEGLGSMTGKGVGYCAPGYVDNRGVRLGLGRSRCNFGCRLGRRRGKGLGRDLRRGYNYGSNVQFNNTNITVDDKVNYLKDEAKVLKDELKDIQNQIDSLETNQED